MLRECVILAGGKGTRLRATVPDMPKVLAPVAGRPFLDLLCAWLARAGMRRVVFSLGYRAQDIARHVGARFMGMETACAVESTPLGTGGGVRLALQSCHGDAVLVLNGDTFLEFDLSALSQCWQVCRGPIILGVQVADTSRYGRLALQGEDVVGLEEKGVPGPGCINAGAYVLPRHALEGFAAGAAFSLEQDFLVPSVRKTPFRLFRVEGMFIDIGIPQDYQVAQQRLAWLAHLAA